MNQVVDTLLQELVEAREKINHLKQIVEDVSNESGTDAVMSAITKETGKTPQYEITVAHLLKEIEKRDIQLENRKNEITNLHIALQTKNEKIDSLKENLVKYSEVSEKMNNILSSYDDPKDAYQVIMEAKNVYSSRFTKTDTKL